MIRWKSSHLKFKDYHHTRAAKKMKKNKWWCIVDDNFDNYVTLNDFERILLVIYRIGIEEAIKTDLRSFFCWVNWSQEEASDGYPSVMSFEGSLASGSSGNFWSFWWIYRAEVSWFPSSSGPNLVNDEPPFGSLQFTVLEVDMNMSLFTPKLNSQPSHISYW
jgi:hypothetical protein